MLDVNAMAGHGAVLVACLFPLLVKMATNYADIDRVSKLDAGFQQVPLVQIF